jgi:hypothetical protein
MYFNIEFSSISRIFDIEVFIILSGLAHNPFPKSSAPVLQHQMALCQSQIRFSVTDHRYGHFCEESLEKTTVLTSKRHSRA